MWEPLSWYVSVGQLEQPRSLVAPEPAQSSCETSWPCPHPPQASHAVWLLLLLLNLPEVQLVHVYPLLVVVQLPLR